MACKANNMVPKYLTDLVVRRSEITTLKTRRISKIRMSVSFARTAAHPSSFIFEHQNLWNALPDKITESKLMNMF